MSDLPNPDDERDEKFFDVLAGRRTADDADSRRAARMRRYFEMHPSLEERPRDDPQGEAQLIAWMRARQPAAAAAAAAPALTTVSSVESANASRGAAPPHRRAPDGQPGPLRRFAEWLFPAGSGRGMGWGMAAAAVLGAVLVLRVMDTGSDDTTQMKSLPTLGIGAETVRSADPAHSATEVQALLSANGVTGTLTPQGRELLLQAEVPEPVRLPVSQGLAAMGLVLPADGKLNLRFAPNPP